MNAREHLDKAERFGETGRKWSAEEDYEAIMWVRMHMATHWMNAALHAAGVTPEDFDISHTWYLDKMRAPERLAAELDEGFLQALASLAVFENLRMTHVRLAGPFGPEALRASDAAFEHIRAFCREKMEAGR